MDKRIDNYIEKQKSPQKDICKKIRAIILKTLPNIKEEMKWEFLHMRMESTILLH
jgi:uncharacterized protein YdhG (YjbR/CyaY superfamily)